MYRNVHYRHLIWRLGWLSICSISTTLSLFQGHIKGVSGEETDCFSILHIIQMDRGIMF